MKVMSFNIRGCYFDDGSNRWQHRRELNIATILKYAPDILGIQEVQACNFNDYAQPLHNYDVERGLITINQRDTDHHEAIFWKQARFQKLDSGGCFYLSETPTA